MFAIFTLPWQLRGLGSSSSKPGDNTINRHPKQGGGGGGEWGGVHSHCNCNKLNKTNVLSAEMSRKLKNSRISISSIDTSIYPLEIHVAVSNINMDVRILFQGHFVVIVSSSLL